MTNTQPITHYDNLLRTNAVFSFITTKHGSEQELLKTEKCEWPIYFIDQVHGNNFKVIKNQNVSGSMGEADAMITDRKKILLRVRVADCLPVLAYFPDQFIAAIHSGRASTEGNIVGKVLQFIKENNKTHEQPILWLGPCICFDCYQIDRETDLHYDMRGRVVTQIKNVYPEAKILHLNSCTLENPQWHSYRENKTQERMYAYIGMK